MCGLAGLFTLDAARDIDEPLLRRMTAALAHRGPDGDGFLIEPGIGLGHRRLAIIDPNAGHQPMFNEDRSVGVVFNGLIYNFHDLQPELRARGHVLATRCDTETIVHAWEEWGPACLEKMEGMFAFALWDRRSETLFIARDRLGEKPLYYATLPDGQFAFASEMAGLREIGGLSRTLRPASVDDFLAYGYVPDPNTIYQEVRRLPAAHYLLLRRGEPIEPRRYWRARPAPHPIAEADAIAELTDRLRAATATRLLADVPLGAFLSGGVDFERYRGPGRRAA